MYRYVILGLGVLGFMASCITMYGAWATFTKTKKDDAWAKRIKEGYYLAWKWAIRLAFAFRRWKKEKH